MLFDIGDNVKFIVDGKVKEGVVVDVDSRVASIRLNGFLIRHYNIQDIQVLEVKHASYQSA